MQKKHFLPFFIALSLVFSLWCALPKKHDPHKVFKKTATGKTVRIPRRDILRKTGDLGKQLAEILGDNASRFLWGASTSAHQNNGAECTENNCDFARLANDLNKTREGGSIIPTASESMYLNPQHLIAQAKSIGLNSLRFSVEWAQIQPMGPNEWDARAMRVYGNFFVSLIKNDITPLVVFHHYTNPCWFIDRGGFSVKNNSTRYFAPFCRHVYTAFMEALSQDQEALEALKNMAPRLPLWATFNSPEKVAYGGYYKKDLPPLAGTKQSGSIRKAACVQGNILDAHVQAYQAIKKQWKALFGHFPEPQIGILKNIYQLTPAPGQTFLDSMKAQCACTMGNYLQHTSILRFFSSGLYTVPFFGILQYNGNAKQSLDFIGLNYYSNGLMKGSEIIEETSPTLATDNSRYRIYPQGLREAILELWEYGAKHIKKHGNPIPIYVSENGIATDDEEKRFNFYCDYLQELHRAQQILKPKKGLVLGYFPWSLCDNYEWPKLEGEQKRRKYGLFAGTKLKNGARSYAEIVAGFKG